MYALASRIKGKKLFIAVGALLVLLASSAGFFFWQYMNLKQQSAQSGAGEASAESKQVIGWVDKLYKLPTGEEPSVAQIQDKQKLAGQVFFADAQNGDYVLVYQKAQQAFLYRKTENRLINVAPVDIEQKDSGQAAGVNTEASPATKP